MGGAPSHLRRMVKMRSPRREPTLSKYRQRMASTIALVRAPTNVPSITCRGGHRGSCRPLKRGWGAQQDGDGNRCEVRGQGLGQLYRTVPGHGILGPNFQENGCTTIFLRQGPNFVSATFTPIGGKCTIPQLEGGEPITLSTTGSWRTWPRKRDATTHN